MSCLVFQDLCNVIELRLTNLEVETGIGNFVGNKQDLNLFFASFHTSMLRNTFKATMTSSMHLGLTWRDCCSNSITHAIFLHQCEMYSYALEHLLLTPDPHKYFLGMKTPPLPFLTSRRNLHGISVVQGIQFFTQ